MVIAPRPMPDGRASIHGTAIDWRERGLLILGPSGSGKSGLAAQMIVLGARLVADDLVVLSGEGGWIYAAPPDGRAPLLELRGLFPVAPQSVSRTQLAAALLLEPSTARMPDTERMNVLGSSLPLWRHPPSPDLAAKAILALTGDAP